MTDPKKPKPTPPFGVKLFAAVKILKGVAFAVLSLGLFRIAHRDIEDLARQLIDFLRVSPENRYAHMILEKAGDAGLVDPHVIMRASALTSIYASILLLEGLGLWFGASWAEYLVVLSTGLFVPEEILACVHRFTWTKFAILAVNAAILFYFVGVLWRQRWRHKVVPSSATPTANT